MDEPKIPLSFLAANMKREMCQWLILLYSGIKTTNHSGESVLVLRLVKGCLSRDFMEVQCSDFQTFESLLNIWIPGPRAWNLDWVRVKWVPGMCMLENPWWCMDRSPFGPSPGLTKLAHAHVNRFLMTLPLCLLQCGLMASHKNTTSWCHSTGDTVQTSAWLGDCKGDVDSPSSSRWRVWETFGAIILRWRSQTST